ncbi:hypothetical protein AB0B30_12090 [Streptomyces narbonensis]|uniref:Uncharacterized protein n=1 Tax=Streptomyces narbonensis TaxID=67333 RepID=A0ABV3CCQ0_9ACTN
MPTQEIALTLTPQQAATGVVIPVTLPTGPTRISVPPCRHGDLVPVWLGDTMVQLRITVAAGSRPARKSNVFGCLIPLVVIGGLVGASFLLNDEDDRAGSRGPGPIPTFSVSPFPTLDPLGTPTGGPADTPTDAPTEEKPDPYDKGTCLNGQLPDSETAQTVDDVEEVPCSASDAHYKVIQTFPFTSDMSRCDSNPKTQYAFSHRYTMNGAVVSQYVYCLVGLGSYAR